MVGWGVGGFCGSECGGWVMTVWMFELVFGKMWGRGEKSKKCILYIIHMLNVGYICMLIKILGKKGVRTVLQNIVAVLDLQ